LLAIVLTVFQLVHFSLSEGSIRAFPIQVRFWYLMFLIVAFPEALRLICWIPAIGIRAQVIFGYCNMARYVSLLPWNRSERFSLELLKRTFFSAHIGRHCR